MAVRADQGDGYAYFCDASSLPEEGIDSPQCVLPLLPSGDPALVFGAATLSTVYNSSEHLNTIVPLRTLRLALRYGITSFDTSPYYGNSEIVLGTLLKALASDYPRSSYKLISKCGRYGTNKKDFDYSPATIRESLMRTLRRLGTEYLDVLYLHDVEFVASLPSPSLNSADPSVIITQEPTREPWGLGLGDEAKIWGEGDQIILKAWEELRKLKEEGLVRSIGITGYPLPVLLRLALLIRSHFNNEPVDALLSYSHYTLQNDTLKQYTPHFTDRAGIKQLYCASPLNMGFFSPRVPEWHMAPPGMWEPREQAIKVAQSDNWPGGLADLALGFGLRRERLGSGTDGKLLSFSIPTVVGLSSVEEVHHAVKVWHEVNSIRSKDQDERRVSLERRIKKCFVEAGWSNWSWDSGGGT